MKTLKYILVFALIIASHSTQSQEILYVSAESGLLVRENPDVSANRVAKLKYGTKVEAIENTNSKLVILDNGKKVTGEWIKIKMTNAYEDKSYGYAFNGYLTEKEIKKPTKVMFNEFTLYINNLSAYNRNDELLKIQKDKASVYVELGDSPEDKTLIIDQEDDYKNVDIFQSYESKVSASNREVSCDLSNLNQFNSLWKPLKKITHSKYKIRSFSEEEIKRFKNLSIKEFKKIAKEQCNTSSESDNKINLIMSRILIKIILTDFNNIKTEKIISFEIPIDC